MGIIDGIFAKQIDERAKALTAGMRDELMRIVVRETTASEAADMAFRMGDTRTGKFRSGLTDAEMERIINDSNLVYETHGLGYRLVRRVLSIIFGGGLDMKVSFLKGFPEAYERETRKRLEQVFYDEDLDIQNRAEEFVLEALINGEHGWQIYPVYDNIGNPTGKFEIGDICRADVAEIHTLKRDRRTLESIKVYDDAGKPGDTLMNMRKSSDGPTDGFLVGDCLYYRYDSRASKKRGSPILQRVIDDVKAERKFAIRMSDRTLARMAMYWLVTVSGLSGKPFDDWVAKQPRTLPAGGVQYQNDAQKTENISANIEAGDIVAMEKLLIMRILGAMGMPPSWFAIEESANRSTAETQQEPAERDSQKDKARIFELFEKLMYYALDQILMAKLISTSDPREEVQVEDEGGNLVAKKLRECITIKITPRPLQKRIPDQPLAATKSAMDVLLIAQDIEDRGRKIWNEERVAQLLTHAGGIDGTEIEFDPSEIEAVQPAGAFPTMQGGAAL